MKILIVGSGGNLGQAVLESLTQTNHSLFFSTRNLSHGNHINIRPFDEFDDLDGYCPEIVINLANSYFTTPKTQQIEQMRESILGVTEAILNANKRWNAMIISVSTYFQYAPDEFQPWSEYAELKKQAQDLIDRDSILVGVPNYEIVLRDNFGGLRKSKFLDLAIAANVNSSAFSANPGESLLNLVYINDIAASLSRLANKDQLKLIDPGRYEIAAGKDYSLMELVHMVDEISGSATLVNWGAYPYRQHEVFESWISGKPFPLYLPTMSIEDYIKKELQQLFQIPGR